MAEETPRPRVLVLWARPRDRELAGRLLESLGADSVPPEAYRDLGRLDEEGRLDLILADSAGGPGPLGALLRALDARPATRDLPVIVLGDAPDLGLVADLTARRLHATLLAKPVEPAQLAAAITAGLRHGADRREIRRLLAQLEASRDEAERRRAEAEAERRRFLDLVNGLDSVVWEFDAAAGRFTFVSERARDVFGEPPRRWIEDPGFWLGRVLPEDREYARAAWERGLRDGHDFDLEYRARADAGRTIWVREAARARRDPDGRLLGLRGLIWNISKRKKVERQLYKAKSDLVERVAELTYLHELGARLSATLELEPLLEEVLASVLGALGADRGVLRLLDPGRDEPIVAASVGFEGGLTAPADPPDAVAAGHEGDWDVFSTALVARGGRSLGTIAAYFRGPHRPPEAQVRLVERYARQAADFIEHARRHRALRESDRRKDEFLALLTQDPAHPPAVAPPRRPVPDNPGG